MAFSKIRQFITKNLDLLSTQLSKLEGNIDDAIQALTLSKLDVFARVVRLTGAQPRIATVTSGTFLLVDASLGTANLSLDRPRPELAGKMAVLVKFNSGTVNVGVLPPSVGGVQGNVNQATSIVLAGGLHFCICDGQDWWVS